MKKPALYAAAAALGSIAAGLAAVGVANSKRQHELPETLRRRLDAIDRTEVSKGVHLTPLFGKVGPEMVIASLTSPATTREELMTQLRQVDGEMVRGCEEAGLPGDVSKLVVIKSETDPELRVSTQDLMAERGPEGFGGQNEVSAVSGLETQEADVVGGDAQPQDVSLPER